MEIVARCAVAEVCVTKLGAFLVRAAYRSTAQLAPSGSFRNPLAWLFNRP
jgi:hypothetical protein